MCYNNKVNKMPDISQKLCVSLPTLVQQRDQDVDVSQT